MVNADRLLTGPEYYLGDLDFDAHQFGFYAVDEGQFRQSTFHDRDRVKGIRSGRVTADFSTDAQLPRDEKKINYILHTAFCCSTLLARCLDIPGKCIAFREPNVLMQLSNYKRMHPAQTGDDGFFPWIYESSTHLIAKTANRGESTIIKPTNAANNLANDILQAGNTGGVLLLYSKLEYFLASIIKKGEGCRAFVRQLFGVVRGDSPRTRSIPPPTLFGLTDLQIATLLWHQQMDQFRCLLDDPRAVGIQTLDCDDFLADPAGVLGVLAGLFKLPLDEEEISAVVRSDVFTRFSKDSARSYDRDMRSAEYSRILEEHRAEIEMSVEWGSRLQPTGAVQLPLPRAVLQK